MTAPHRNIQAFPGRSCHAPVTAAGLTCGDSDTVTVAEKLCDRRRHDDDRYNDKGKGRDRD